MARRLLGKVKAAAWLVSAVLLAACTVQLVAPYDQVIDDGLMSFNRDFLQFMAEIEQNVPSEDASYASNRSFYNAQQAAIGTLVQRAKASDPGGSCSSAAITQGADRIGTLMGLHEADHHAARAQRCDLIQRRRLNLEENVASLQNCLRGGQELGVLE